MRVNPVESDITITYRLNSTICLGLSVTEPSTG